MQPLVSIETHNHVSLFSITIAPSTFLIALAFTFAFLYVYLVSIGHIPVGNVIPASRWTLPRVSFKAPSPIIPRQPAIEAPRQRKPLPALPAPEGTDLGKSIIRLTGEASSQVLTPPPAQTLRSYFSFFSLRARATLPSPSINPNPRPPIQLLREKEDDDIPILRRQPRREKLRNADVTTAEAVRVPSNPLRLWLLGRGPRPTRRERRQHGRHVAVQR